jgi:hypothetical protein
MAGVRVKSGEKYAFVQANRARFSSGALQWQVLIALCPQRRRFAVGKAGKRRDAGRKTAGIRRIPAKTVIALRLNAAHPHSGMGVLSSLSTVFAVTTAPANCARRLTGRDALLHLVPRAQGSLWLGPASPVGAAASQASVRGPEWRTTQSPCRAASPQSQSRLRS